MFKQQHLVEKQGADIETGQTWKDLGYHTLKQWHLEEKWKTDADDIGHYHLEEIQETEADLSYHMPQQGQLEEKQGMGCHTLRDK